MQWNAREDNSEAPGTVYQMLGSKGGDGSATSSLLLLLLLLQCCQIRVLYFYTSDLLHLRNSPLSLVDIL